MTDIRQGDGLVPAELLEPVTAAVEKFAFRYGWNSNHRLDGAFGHWNHKIASSGKKKNTVDVSERLLRARMYAPFIPWWAWVRENVVGENAALLRLYVNAHTYGVEGYPHCDSKRAGETTILTYLNRGWRREWAGETVLFTEAGDEIDASVLPKYGRMLMFPSERWHVARGVTRMCPVARMTLVLKVGPKDRGRSGAPA